MGDLEALGGRVAPIDHTMPDRLARFGVADDWSGLGRGYGVGKVLMAWEQIPTLYDTCSAFIATER